MTQNYGPIKNIDKFLGARAYEKIAGERLAERFAVTDGALAELLRRLIRMRGIAVRSSGDLISNEERALFQREVDSIKKEIDEIAEAISSICEAPRAPGGDLEAAAREMDSALSNAVEILNELDSLNDPGASAGSAELSGPGPDTAENTGADRLDDDELTDWMNSLM
ncbi:MAG: hypothetical protein LBT31_03600 [Synergistaceae bacterium]|nr:hypothetical protein [Synergistaceae bacterium]